MLNRKLFSWRKRGLPSTEPSLVRDAFDREFYLSTYPDIARKEGIDPVEHYCLVGWKERRDPGPGFSTGHYLDTNPDVRDAGINPFHHYLSNGRAEGRTASPHASAPPVPAKGRDPDAAPSAGELSLVRDAFDEGFYLSTYPDIAKEKDVDPVAHYCATGWRERRDPAADFSTGYYLDSNPDVQRAGVNPFFHYLSSGKAEGKRTRHPGGAIVTVLSDMKPLQETAGAWRSKPAPERIVSSAELGDRLERAGGAGSGKLMISASHDNYRKVVGGVQYSIQREEKVALDRGMTYLHISPYAIEPQFARRDRASEILVTVVLNGRTVGVAHMTSVIDVVRRTADGFPEIEVVIHHLMGHIPEQVADLVEATGRGRCWLWIHDFFTLCPSYALQRNNVAFCGAPPPDSNACSLCLYGEERLRHRERMAAFFDRLSVDVIAPSAFAADFWRGKTDLAFDGLTVRDHLDMTFEGPDGEPRGGRAEDDPITVAFVGFPSIHKGWFVFRDIVTEFGNGEGNIRFVYFGEADVGLRGLEKVNARVSAEDPSAMIDAMRDHGVDLVVHWALCAETFSFSTYEAFSSGAFVLTNPRSGNVAALVERTGLGAILEDEADLKAFFRDGRIEALTRDLRSRRPARKATLTYSDMTFSAIDERR